MSDRTTIIVRLVAFFHMCHYAYGLPLWWAQAACRVLIEGVWWDFDPELWWWAHEAACYSNHNWGMIVEEDRTKIHNLILKCFPTPS